MSRVLCKSTIALIPSLASSTSPHFRFKHFRTSSSSFPRVSRMTTEAFSSSSSSSSSSAASPSPSSAIDFLSLCHRLKAKFHIIQELLGRLHATVTNRDASETYKSLLRELNEERQKTRYKMKGMFNKSFGATFLTDTGQESAFVYHIHQYTDIYTSKPENFLYYPPEPWLHVPFDIKIMPHHLKVPSNLFRN